MVPNCRYSLTNNDEDLEISVTKHSAAQGVQLKCPTERFLLAGHQTLCSPNCENQEQRNILVPQGNAKKTTPPQGHAKKTTPQPHLGHCFLIAPLVKPGLRYNHTPAEAPDIIIKYCLKCMIFMRKGGTTENLEK